MNKKYYMIVLVFASLFSFQAKAQPKIDIMAGVERVLGTVMTKVEEVMERVNSAAKSFQENLLGESFKTNYETFMALKQDIKDKFDAGKEAYEQAQEAYNEGLKMYNEGKSFVEGVEGGVTGAYEETVEKLKSMNVSSPAALESQMADLQQQMNDHGEVKKEELEAKLRVVNENRDVLEKIYDETDNEDTKEMISVLIADADLMRDQYLADIEALGNNAGMDEEYQQMQSQYNQMASMLDELKEAAKDKASGLAASFVKGMIAKTKEQKKAEYQALGDANFAKPDEPLNQVTVDRINNERKKNLIDDIASSYAHTIQYRSEKQKREDERERVADNIGEADYAVTAERLLNEQEIQKIKRMHDNIAIELSDLKTKTSGNMMLQGFRQQNPNKNPAELNLDSYELTVEGLQGMGLGK